MSQCHKCRGWGHNRRGCPVIKESHAKVEAMAKKYGIPLPSKDEYISTQWIVKINEANMAANGDDAYAKDEISYTDRWNWEELEERKRAQAQKNVRQRTCGFCNQPGHNARTCEAKKQHHKDCDAMQGLAHRVVAACLEKAGIVPGALMQFPDWNNDGVKVRKFAIVTGMDWNQIAPVGYKTKQGLPRNFHDWFNRSFIQTQEAQGDTRTSVIPRNIPQQSACRFSDRYFDAATDYGVASPVLGGRVNKDNGWKGDNVTLISPSAEGIYRMSKEGTSDQDLNPIVEQLVSSAGSMWNDY